MNHKLYYPVSNRAVRWIADGRIRVLGLCKKVCFAEIDAKFNGMITIDSKC
jgi:hypothetical protein